MPTAFKVVTDRYTSVAADDHPNLQYRVGPVRQIGPGGVYGYTALSSAVKRAYWARKSPRLMSKQRIVALDYDEADNLESGDERLVRLARCTVIGEVPIVDYDSWQTIPGATVDLRPAAAVIAGQVFPFLMQRHSVSHWRATAEIAAQLIPDVPDADPDVVAAFTLLHDAKRRSVSDKDDGPLAAALARELHAQGDLQLDDAQLETLCDALANDYPPATSTDPTIGLSWDSCRLASVVVITLLSTDAAKARGA